MKKLVLLFFLFFLLFSFNIVNAISKPVTCSGPLMIGPFVQGCPPVWGIVGGGGSEAA